MREELDIIHELHMADYGEVREHYYHYNGYTIFVDKWGFIDEIIPTSELGF